VVVVKYVVVSHIWQGIVLIKGRMDLVMVVLKGLSITVSFFLQKKMNGFYALIFVVLMLSAALLFNLFGTCVSLVYL